MITDNISLITNAKKVVLLDPANVRKYMPLGLAKIATYVKSNGGEVVFQRKYTPCNEDLVCVTSLFTWYAKKVHEAIDQVVNANIFFNPKLKILVGGTYVTLMPKHLAELYPQVYIYTGCSRILDECAPDYTLDYNLEKKWDDISYIYTSRGCPNHCQYCSAWKIEPEQYIIKNWRNHIHPDRTQVMINDNNLSSQSMDHIKSIFDYMIEHKKKVNLKNGFDCKYITDEMASILGKQKFAPRGMRLSFDRIEEDGIFQEAVRKLITAGVSRHNIMVYVLYNFNERVSEAIYRANECIKLGVAPWPQEYTTMNKLDIHDKYLGKHWTVNLRAAFKLFHLFGGYYKKMSFLDWCLNEGKNNNTYHFTDEEIRKVKGKDI